MTNSNNMGLNSCGCCKSDAGEHVHDNQPGLVEIQYRIGVYSSFMQRMVERLGREEVPDGEHAGTRPLAKLTTRSLSDPAIALLDAWAVTADVLTFYQERIANEAYLRTATERRSVLELARAISYELNPGVSASTHLAFSLDEAESSPDSVIIPLGTQVLSIPTKDGELPQTFETSNEFEARVEWNTLYPRMTEPQPIEHGETELFLNGISTRLQPGDGILLVGNEREAFSGSERWDFRLLHTVETFPEEGYTRVTWQTGLGHNQPTVHPADNPKVFAFRQRAALFGHNAPDWRTMPDNIKLFYDSDWNPDEPDRTKTQWPDFKIQTVDKNIIDLDTKYPKILVESWIVLSKPTYRELYRIIKATSDSRTDYTLTAQVTRLELDTNEHLHFFGLRDTIVFAQSEELKLTQKPYTVPIKKHTIELDRHIQGLQQDQPIIITGKLNEDDEDLSSEVAFIDSTIDNDSFTTIILQDDLENTYVRPSVTVRANVVPATHGETVVNEVLGSGDGSKAHQSFKLKKAPLTFVSASNPQGAESSIAVRVNGILWNESSTLYQKKSTAETFIIRINNEAEATVKIGDGVSGARLPTGQENIHATYRFGIGLVGEVEANSLSLLKKRPFGVRSVTNPTPAIGAADPEKLDNARTNAPLTVLTLDRIVSLQDFEDFTRAFTGIGKAQAASVWNGESNIVHITIADENGDSVPQGLILYQKLEEAIDVARDPTAQVYIDSYELLSFNIEANITYDSRFIAEELQTEIEQLLQSEFSFEQRKFGQVATAAEIMQIIHQVDGVVSVDLNAFYLTDTTPPDEPPAMIPVHFARFENQEMLPAQLLLVNPSEIQLFMKTI